MRKIQLLLFLCLLCSVTNIRAQQTAKKNFNGKVRAGDAYLLYTYAEYSGSASSRIYIVDIPRADKYYFSSLANMNMGQGFKVYIDNNPLGAVYANGYGWQFVSVRDGYATLNAGKHTVKIVGENSMAPMMEEIFLTVSMPSGRESSPAAVAEFLDKMEILKQKPVLSSQEQQVSDISSKVLPNPEGLYAHAIDTAFAYSHYSVIYLTPGNYTFTTAGSTVSRALTIFTSSNSYSGSNVNGGAGGESMLNIPVSTSDYYIIMLRPTVNGTTGTTNIYRNGSLLVADAVIAGKTYDMGSLKAGPLNFFTCRLNATGDTRMLVSRSSASSARGYNDDYNTGSGDFAWGLSSRIKKDFGTDSVRYGFVCAYSPASTGTCDIYLGNENSNVYADNYPEFPLLKPDDAIKAASSSGYYNCISWSGGITSSWSWPPSAYSTYNCANTGWDYSDITCFDNFYGNSPVRYPGAWNYTRSGATVNNATVDVWKLGISYTHGSVRKPGNNHPHGYDWESKPGGLTRTFHPRNALTNNSWGYGAVSDYYRATGTFARTAGVTEAIESDADAVKAGLAIFDVAKLSDEAERKLRSLTSKVDPGFENQFNALYEQWKKTWAANAVYSDPAMYCKNPEHKALAELARSNSHSAMMLIFGKFVGGDHLIGELMWTLTKEKYAPLLAEVKTERAASPNDASGRYRIHGDHDNGVLYVEKILRSMEAEQVVVANDDINVVVSPNPVSDRLSIQVVTTKTSRIRISMISSQTGLTKPVQQETVVGAGTHRFTTSIQGFAGNNGDIIAVQVIIDGVMKIVKVLVAK